MNKLLALIPLFLLLFAVGCAGNGTSSPGTAAYAGTYTGTTTLDSGKKGDLNFTLAADGTATGSLTVSAPAASKAGDFNFTFGTMQIEGHISDDGTLTMTGTDPNSGNFEITGKVNPDGTATLTITASGSTFTVNVNITTGGGSGSITFSNGSSTNANLTAYPSNPFILLSDVNGHAAILVVPSTSDTTRNFSIALDDTMTAGVSHTFDGTSFDVCSMTYNEGDRSWRASSGQLKVVSRTATSFEIQLVNVGFVAETGGGSTATGSFTVNGTIKK